MLLLQLKAGARGAIPLQLWPRAAAETLQKQLPNANVFASRDRFNIRDFTNNFERQAQLWCSRSLASSLRAGRRAVGFCVPCVIKGLRCSLYAQCSCEMWNC
jgi:hypothetical protein